MKASRVLHPLPDSGFASWLEGAVARLATNESARRLYEALGFQVHSLQMSRPLPPQRS